MAGRARRVPEHTLGLGFVLSTRLALHLSSTPPVKLSEHGTRYFSQICPKLTAKFITPCCDPLLLILSEIFVQRV